MTIVAYSQARQNLSEVLNKAKTQSVIITRKDGTRYKIDSIEGNNTKSPFEIASPISNISCNDILSALQETRAKQ